MALKIKRRLKKKTYGRWAGRPYGAPENMARCRYEVAEVGMGCHFHQCRRKRGYGPRKVFCKQHAKKFAEGSLMFGEDYI
jgi:hypothetical protein